VTELLVDTSVWHRSSHPSVQAAWIANLDADRLVLCPQVRLEVLYSARSAPDYVRLADELDGLRQVATTDAAFNRALDVQRQLAHVSGLHHRSVKIADLLIGATAELSGLSVWHYDEDFDRIAALTGQPTEWVAPRGSL
jgi:predicted nucleic acid-binding protein